MGRRPKPIIIEFFLRDNQTRDHGNRYDHTCRRCGKFFAKGRVETMLAHLMKKCPSISQDERERIRASTESQDGSTGRAPVASLANVSPETAPSAEPEGLAAAESASAMQTRSKSPASPMETATVDAPEEANSGPMTPDVTEQKIKVYANSPLVCTVSALDTLAEASRHHLEQSTYPTARADDEQNDGHRKEELDRANFIAQLQAATRSTPVGMQSSHDITAHLSQFRPLSSPPSLVAYSVPTPMQQPSPEWGEQDDEVMASNTATEQPLVQTANAGRKRMRDEIDPGIEGGGGDAQPTPEEGRATSMMDLSPPTPPPPATGQFFHNLDPTMYLSNGTFERPTKSTARTRFSDARRQEVSKVRKQGACIRCRMLKKPCSEGTSCTTCLGIESARLWRAPCLRTKLNESFTLWSAGLFQAGCQAECQATTHGMEPTSVYGCVEIRLVPRSDYGMAFSITKFTPTLVNYRAAFNDDAIAAQQAPQDVLLLSEDEMYTSKLQTYTSYVTSACIEAEPNSFMKMTLQQAQQMLQTDAVRGGDGIQPEGSRSCYTVHTQLLNEVIVMWVTTTFLALQHRHEISIRFNESKAAERQPTPIVVEAESRISTQSETLILTQIRAVLEAQCKRLGKIVMNELERRLLQRQQVSRFTTFITAVILLNCVERMTGVFRTFDQTAPPPTEDQSAGTRPEYEPTRPSHWPLKDSPSKFWPQGEQVTNLVVMLLRMRALPPKVKSTEEGILRVDTFDKRKIKDQGDEQSALPGEWLDSLCLRTEELLKLRDEPLPGRDDRVEAWDLKFVLRALLPAKA